MFIHLCLTLVFCEPLSSTLRDEKIEMCAINKKMNLPTMQETPVRFLGQEDPLQKG